jgi:hypothetical protein
MTGRFRAQRNRRIEGVDDDREVIALVGPHPFKYPGSTQTACLPDDSWRSRAHRFCARSMKRCNPDLRELVT